MKKILLFTLLSLTLHSYGQTTSVPDVEFEKYLEANSMGNGVANDGLVLTSNINTVTELNITDLDINDLTGIEDFLALEKLDAEFIGFDIPSNLDLSALKNLTYLNFALNSISTVNLSENTKLTHVDFSNCEITSINLENNPLITYLNLDYNFDIQNLSFLADLPDLVYLNLTGFEISSINLSNNIKLKEFIGDDLWELTSLDISSNLDLEKISLSENELTSIDLSNNTKLIELNMELLPADYSYVRAKLKNLDLSKNIMLEKLELGNNKKLTSLDLSKNIELNYLDLYDCYTLEGDYDLQNHTKLTIVDFGNCNISSLNIKNEQNTKIEYFHSSGNENLTCITVDDVDYSTSTWANDSLNQGNFSVDSTQSFSSDCTLSVAKFNQIDFDLHPNPSNNTINIKSLATISAISIYNVFGKEVLKVKNTNNKINISNLSSGVYIVKVYSDNKTGITKLIKN